MRSIKRREGKMKLNTVALVFLAMASCLFFTPTWSRAAAVGSFSKVEGQVDILRAGRAGAIAAHVGDGVELNDSVRTKKNSKAEIQFQDDSVIRLAPETLITVDEYSFQPDGSRDHGLLGLFRGKMRSVVSKVKEVATTVSQNESNFKIKTPTTIAGVRGTDFLVYYERGVTGVIFVEGHGFIFNQRKPARVVPIKAGQAAFVTGKDDEPEDAVPVPDTFVAPHLKDTTIGLTGTGNLSPFLQDYRPGAGPADLAHASSAAALQQTGNGETSAPDAPPAAASLTSGGGQPGAGNPSPGGPGSPSGSGQVSAGDLYSASPGRESTPGSPSVDILTVNTTYAALTDLGVFAGTPGLPGTPQRSGILFAINNPPPSSPPFTVTHPPTPTETAVTVDIRLPPAP